MNRMVPTGTAALQKKGWLMSHRWLIARRSMQLGILSLFLLGPWFDIWIVHGNLNSSLTLDVLPLTDPYLLVQTLFAGHMPEMIAITGALIVIVLYLLVGGRVYCSWVCPVNIITDTANWLRDVIGLSGASHMSRNIRYWLLAATFLLAMITGTLAWETVNPVSVAHRGIIFGMGSAWLILAAIFLMDMIISKRAWCGHLCPTGAFYSSLSTHSLVRVRADGRDDCNDCMDCFIVCPEQQVIRPALKGAETGMGPVIDSPNCTNCGRCIDICSEDVFHFGTRLNNVTPDNRNSKHPSGAGVI